MHTFFRTKMPIVLFDDKLQKHSEKMRERERKRVRLGVDNHQRWVSEGYSKSY